MATFYAAPGASTAHRVPALRAGLAVVVGINYEGSARLHNAVRDAARVADILRTRHGFDVISVCNADATRANLEDMLRRLPEIGKPYAQVVFYFAGHGRRRDSEDGELAGEFLTTGFPGDPAAHLAMATVRATLERLVGPRQILILVDCCAAGAMGHRSRDVVFDDEPRPLYQERFARLLGHRAVQLIVSAAYDEKARDSIATRQRYEDEATEHSPFAQAVIDALSCSPERHVVDRNHDGLFLATELYGYVFGRLDQWNQVHPDVPPQTPEHFALGGHEGGNFLFCSGTELVELKRAAIELRHLVPFRDSPYREADAPLFFGRGGAVDEVMALVEKHPMTVIAGASGSGKTSLVHAGLLPRCRRAAWQPILLDDGAMPPDPPPDAPCVYVAELRRFSTPVANDDLLRILDRIASLGRHRLIVTLHAGDEDLVLARVSEQTRSMWQNRYAIPVMHRDHLREVIEQAAERVVLFFPHGPRPTEAAAARTEPPRNAMLRDQGTLVDTLLDELEQAPGELAPGRLALLSAALHRMVLRPLADGDRRVGWNDYDAARGIRQALIDDADRIVREEQDAANREALRRILLRLVDLRGPTPAPRKARRDEFCDFGDRDEDARVARLLDKLEAARLIVRGATVELAHGVLATSWPQMTEWSKAHGQRQKDVYELRAHAEKYAALAPRAVARSGHKKRRIVPLRDDALRALLRFLRPERTTPPWWARLRDFLAPSALVAAPRFELNARERAVVVASLRMRRRRGLIALGAVVGSVAVASAIWLIWARAVQARAEQEAIAALDDLRDKAQHAGDGDAAFQTALTAYHIDRWKLGSHLPEAIEPLAEIAGATQARPAAAFEASHHVYDLRLAGDEITAVVRDGEDRVVIRWHRGGSVVPVSLGPTARASTVLMLSPDGDRVATEHDGCVALWDSHTGAAAAPAELCVDSGPGGCSQLMTIAFSGDGSRLAAGDISGRIHVWDISTGVRIVSSRAFDRDAVRLLALDRSGRHALTAASHIYFDLYWLDLDHEGKVKLDGPQQAVNAAVFSPDGRWFAAGGEDGKVRIWDAGAAPPLLSRELSGHDQAIDHLAFDARGDRLVSASRDTTAIVWDLRAASGPSSRRLRGHAVPVVGAAFDADDAVATLDARDRVLIWRLHPPQVRLDLHHDDAVTSVAVSRDGRRIATSSRDHSVRIFDARTGALLKRVMSPQPFTDVAFGDAGEWLVAVGDDREVIEIDRERVSLGVHDHPVLKVAMSSNGRFATASQDGTAKVWRVDNGERALVVSLPHSPLPGAQRESRPDARYFVLDVAWDPSGTRVVTTGADHRVVVWHIQWDRGMATPHELTISGGTAHAGPVRSVGWSADGQYLVSGSEDGTARLWDGRSYELRATLQPHGGAISRVAFSPDGVLVMAASGDGLARIWSVKTRALTSVLRHGSPITDAGFAPGSRGHIAVTSGYDGTVKVWNADTEALLALQAGHGGAVHRIAFTPDGKQLVVASDNHDARILPLDIEQAEAAMIDVCGPASLTVGICAMRSESWTGAAPPRKAPLPPPSPGGSAGPSDSAGWPDRLTARVAVAVSFGYGALLRTRTVYPDIDVSVERTDSSKYEIAFGYRWFQPCKFTGSLQGKDIVLAPGSTCRLPIWTPDFCTLKAERCAAPDRLTCGSEAAAESALESKEGKIDRLDAVTGTVRGRLIRAGSAVGVELTLEIDTCLLVEGYLSNRPIPIFGGVIHVIDQNRCR